MNRFCIIVVVSVFAIATSAQAQDNPTTSPSTSEVLDLRYAEAFNKLAMARLQQAEEKNKKVAGTVPSAEIGDLRANVELARKLLTSTKSGERRGRPSVFLQLAQQSVATAERDLKQAKAIRARSSAAKSNVDIQILELRVEMARIQLAAGKKAMERSVEDELEWKVTVLYEEVIRLRAQINKQNR